MVWTCHLLHHRGLYSSTEKHNNKNNNRQYTRKKTSHWLTLNTKLWNLYLKSSHLTMLLQLSPVSSWKLRISVYKAADAFWENRGYFKSHTCIAPTVVVQRTLGLTFKSCPHVQKTVCPFIWSQIVRCHLALKATVGVSFQRLVKPPTTATDHHTTPIRKIELASKTQHFKYSLYCSLPQDTHTSENIWSSHKHHCDHLKQRLFTTNFMRKC